MACRGIKGAITVEGNDAAGILAATRELLTRLLSANQVPNAEVASVIFSCTSDLDAVFPARIAREIGLEAVPLLCTQELDVPGALGRCVRIVVTVNTERTQAEITHLYLRGAAVLRPEFAGESR